MTGRERAVAVGIAICLVAGAFGVYQIVLPAIMSSDPARQLVELHALEAALRQGGYVDAQLDVREPNGQREPRRYLLVQTSPPQAPGRDESTAVDIAHIVLDTYSRIDRLDALVITLAPSGSALSSVDERHTFSHSIADWQARLGDR